MAIGHEDEIPGGEAEIRRDARPLSSDRSLRALHDHFRTGRLDVRYVLRRDALLVPFFGGAIDFFDPAIERSRNRVPEMQERIFLEADVDEHRLQSHLDVLDLTLVDAPNDVPGAVPLDVVFF